MASYIKYPFLFDQAWLFEDIVNNSTAHFDDLNGENTNHNNENSYSLKLPETMGILPIRNVVTYPGTVTPLAVGRERSKTLLEDVRINDTIIGLLTQKSPETDTPDFQDAQ